MRAGVIKNLNIRYLLFQRNIGEISFLKIQCCILFKTFVKSLDVQFVTFLNEESF